MTITNLFTSQLPLGRTLLLAWLTATFFYIRWGVSISFKDVTPIEFAIQAGMLFGYYMLLLVAGRICVWLALFTIGFVVSVFTETDREVRHNPAYSIFRGMYRVPIGMGPPQPDGDSRPSHSRMVALRAILQNVRFSLLGKVFAVIGKSLRNAVNPLVIAMIGLDRSEDSRSRRLGRFSGRIIGNALGVGTMFVGFAFYSERLVRQLAPLGIVVTLVIFVLGAFDNSDDA